MIRARQPAVADTTRQSLELPPELSVVTYHGLGPDENYPDRKAAAVLAAHQAHLYEMHTPYVVPSENGLRCDARRRAAHRRCRWL